MRDDNEIFESLIAGGVIGATLGALLTNNKDEGASVGALIGAAVLGTYKANEKANASRVPMIMEENGKLYRISADGVKEYIRDIEKPNLKLPEHFKLV
jgi:hypothetical protein